MTSRIPQFILITIIIVFTGCKQKKDFEYPFQNPSLSFKHRATDIVERLTLEEKINQMSHNSPAIERLNIPEFYWWNESLHGVARFGRATVFPQPIALASTFDRELIRRVGDAISTEARAKYNIAIENNNRTQYAGLTFWSPNVNIFRDPRWGRGMETWGEDPYLTGELATEFVKGMQGSNPKYLKVASCAKHYAVHSGPEENRHSFNAIPSKKDFFETYMPAFEKLVKEANVESVMCAYNRTFSKPCCGSDYLLTEILRKDWNFDGYIVSDCGAVDDIYKHHKVVETKAEAAALAVKSGVNLNCGTAFKKGLVKAVKQGLITESEIDSSLVQLFKTRFRLGLFDPVENNPYHELNQKDVHTDNNIYLSRVAAQKSVVLLKNNGVLPLNKKIKHLMVLGPTASDVDAMLGNYCGYSNNIVTVLEGITGKVDLGTRLEYRKGFLLDRANLNPISWAIDEARAADASIVVMGVNTTIEGEEGEAIASEYKGDRLDIGLPGKQLEYLKKIRKNNDKPLIVVLTGGSPIAIQELDSIADAVLFAWYPGEQGGNAIADIIFGDVSPSGKLPVTFPESLAQLPEYEDYSMNGRTYRYQDESPLYPFGYGLTYSDIRFEDYKVDFSSEKQALTVRVKIFNTGNYKTDEIIQLYVSLLDQKDTPLKTLIDFKRVTLFPDETAQVKFNLAKNSFSYFDADGNKHSYKGKVRIYIGNCSPGHRSVELGAKVLYEDIEID